ncbi:MAG: hypothetical protein SVS15_07465 [Thermodesulfobacteriota bacterium]|nr:hypothetical protein [Thermodesulfobacteriota bacterium]
MAGWLKIFSKKSKKPSRSAVNSARRGLKSEGMLRFDWDKDGWVDRLIATRYPELRTKSDLLMKLVAEGIKRAGEEEKRKK